MKRVSVFLVALLLATLAAAKPDPEAARSPLLKPDSGQAQAAAWAARFLSRFHYKSEPLDDRMSERMFDRYLDALDGDRLFFLASDIESFKAERLKLDDAISKQDLSAPFAIFNVYVQRAAERTAHSRGLLKAGFDFGVAETYIFEREKAPWAKTNAELDELWRKRVKNDWLRLKLAGKDVEEIRKTLDKRFKNFEARIRELDGEDVFQTFLNAYASSIEPHTSYLAPRASENFNISMRLSLQGIGAVLQREDEYTVIRSIVPGGPADLAGALKVGDRILGVAQGEAAVMVDVLGWRLDDVVDIIRGAKGSVVRLDVLPVDAGPDGAHIVHTLTRDEVKLEEQAAKKSIIEVGVGTTKRRIGVVTLETFYQDFDARRRGDADYKSSTRDVARLLGELKTEKVDGVLIDLRNNGGGSLAEATDLTGLFIDRGPVVQVRNAQGRVEVEKDASAGMAWDGPLAVLVSRYSASASEIFAAAIQDYGRGIIIGEPTFGKGTVQNLVDLDQVANNEQASFGQLKLTIAQFFRINGGSTQHRGVLPDIAFPVTLDAVDFGESALDNALPWTSISAAEFETAGDLHTLIPLLDTRYRERAAKSREFGWLNDDIREYRKARKQTEVSLLESARRSERDEKEAKRLARLAEREAKPTTTADGGDVFIVGHNDVLDGTDPDIPVQPDLSGADDGLQADERRVKDEADKAKQRKEQPDVLLFEAVRILADAVGLLKSDTRLATQAQPYSAPSDPSVAPLEKAQLD